MDAQAKRIGSKWIRAPPHTPLSQQALSLFRSMEAASVRPDVRCVSSVLSALGRGKGYHTANALLEETFEGAFSLR